MRRVVERRGDAALGRPPGGHMDRAGARLGGVPVFFLVAGAIAQGGRGDDRAVGWGDDGFVKRRRRVDPMAVHAHIDVASLAALDAQPVDKLLRRVFR